MSGLRSSNLTGSQRLIDLADCGERGFDGVYMATKPEVKSGVPAVASSETKKPEVKKIPKSVADAMLTAGDITKEQYAKMVESGRVTSGEGGGNPVKDQFVAAGVNAALVDRFFKTLDEVNAALWSATNVYTGKLDAEGRQIEAAVWAKHHEVKKS